MVYYGLLWSIMVYLNLRLFYEYYAMSWKQEQALSNNSNVASVLLIS